MRRRGSLPASGDRRAAAGAREQAAAAQGRFSVAAGKTLRKRARLEQGRAPHAGSKGRGFPARLLITTRDTVPNTDTTRYRVTVVAGDLALACYQAWRGLPRGGSPSARDQEQHQGHDHEHGEGDDRRGWHPGGVTGCQ